MWLARLYLYFMIFSFAGWVFESIWNIIVTHAWENRGFLYGPVCPIYGVGATAIIAAAIVCSRMGLAPTEIPSWQLFLFSFIGSFVLEYSTHWFLEHRFHATWWDYSNMPFNIKGRVCLPASILFGLAGIFLVKAAMPFLEVRFHRISPVLVEAMAMFTLIILSADATLTVSALTDFARRVEYLEEVMNHYMDGVVDGMQLKKKDSSEEDSRFLENVVSHMSFSYRNAIRRVTSFRPPQVITSTTKRTKEIAVRVQEIIKNRGHHHDETQG